MTETEATTATPFSRLRARFSRTTTKIRSGTLAIPKLIGSNIHFVSPILGAIAVWAPLYYMHFYFNKSTRWGNEGNLDDIDELARKKAELERKHAEWEAL